MRAFAFVLGQLAFSADATASTSAPERITFEYTALPECPSAEDVLGQVAAYTTTNWTVGPPHENARRFVLHITKSDGGYIGRFDLYQPNVDGVRRRDVTAEGCEDVALALAIAVATAIDPRTMGAPPEERPSPPPVRPRRAPNVSRPRSSKLAFSVGARGEANGAVSELLAVADFYLELEWTPAAERIPWLRPVLRAGFRQSFTRTNRVGRSEVDIRWSAGQLELCPSRFGLTIRFTVEACLTSNVGQLSAEARNIAGAVPSRSSWFDAGILAAVRWQLHTHLYSEAALGVVFPLTRDRLRVEPDGVVTQAPFAGISGGLGIGWRF